MGTLSSGDMVRSLPPLQSADRTASKECGQITDLRMCCQAERIDSHLIKSHAMYTETNLFAVIIPLAHAGQSFPNVLQIEEMGTGGYSR